MPYIGAVAPGKEAIQSVATWLNNLKSLYKANGLSDQMTDWNLIQDYMESGAFSNNGAKQNNPSNIMFPKKGLPYGKRGTYNKQNKTYYAAFDNLNDYVKEKINVLKQSPGMPINATSSTDYVHRLKLNNFFGDRPEREYKAAMQSTAKNINLISDLKADTDTIVTRPDQNSNEVSSWIMDHKGLVAGVVGGSLLLLLLTNSNRR
jgi:hypothetical protein